MTPRFAVILIGCTLAGAAGAAYHRAASPPVAAPTPPLFMQAVAQAPLSDAWPPEQPVAFYQEIVALLTTAATAAAAAAPAPAPATARQAARPEAAAEIPAPQATITEPPQQRGLPGGSEPSPQRPTVAPQRSNDTVEVVIRDRFGRPIRVERVDRRRFMDSRAYPPPFDRRYGPYGAYAPHWR